MPHGAPPPPPAPAEDVTRFPPPRRVDSQVGILVATLAAGASVPIPGVREDYGLEELIIGTDVAARILVDGIPIRTPAGTSLHLPLGEPMTPAGPHTVTNPGAGAVAVDLYVVGRQRREPDANLDAETIDLHTLAAQATD